MINSLHLIEQGEDPTSGRMVYGLASALVWTQGAVAASYGIGVEVPYGHLTDFASVPRFFWRIFPPFGVYSRAAVIHDYLYDTKPTSRWMADAIFYEVMRELRVPRWKRCLMWLAVRLFGGLTETGKGWK